MPTERAPFPGLLEQIEMSLLDQNNWDYSGYVIWGQTPCLGSLMN